MYKPTPYPPGAERWLINLIDFKNTAKMTSKQIAEQENLAEKSVSNVFSGKSKSPSVNLIRRIIHAISGSWREVFEESGAVIGGQDLAALQAEVIRLSEENATLTSDLNSIKLELAEKSKEAFSLAAENELLRVKLELKEEILSVHNYYIKRYPAE